MYGLWLACIGFILVGFALYMVAVAETKGDKPVSDISRNLAREMAAVAVRQKPPPPPPKKAQTTKCRDPRVLKCPACNAPIPADKVQYTSTVRMTWVGDSKASDPIDAGQTVVCGFCGSTVRT